MRTINPIKSILKNPAEKSGSFFIFGLMEDSGSPTMECINCREILQGPVCHNCGQKVIDKRWTVKGLTTQFLQQLTNIEKGFTHTAVMLFKAPGKLITEYWRGKTLPYYNPFRYTLILVAINILTSIGLGIAEMIQRDFSSFENDSEFSSQQMLIAEQDLWNWLNLLVLLIIPAVALMTFLLFRSKKKNYAEHLIMNTYIYGQQSLITIVTNLIFVVFPSLFSGYMVFNFLIGLAYNSYIYMRTFKEAWWLVLIKALVVGVVGLIVLMGLITAFIYIYLFLTNA